MKLLDLFCGAGGAAMGYHRAGFDEIVGVDNRPMPRYPFTFVQADALEYVVAHGHEFDAIHASPPCQGYSTLKGLTTETRPRLVDGLRRLLQDSGVPWVIENVVGADLRNPVRLCGSMLGLGVWRHRLFEIWPSTILWPDCRHALVPEPVDVTGTGGPFNGTRKSAGGGISRKPRNLAQAREVMGIHWMTRLELSEAIPPAYTEFIGRQLIQALNGNGR